MQKITKAFGDYVEEKGFGASRSMVHVDCCELEDSGLYELKESRKTGFPDVLIYSESPGGKGAAVRSMYKTLVLGKELDPRKNVDGSPFLAYPGDIFVFTDFDGQQDPKEILASYLDLLGSKGYVFAKTERVNPIMMPAQKIDFEDVINRVVIMCLYASGIGVDGLMSSEPLGPGGRRPGIHPRDLQAGGFVMPGSYVGLFSEELVSDNYAIDAEQVIVAAKNVDRIGKPVFLRRADYKEATATGPVDVPVINDGQAFERLKPIADGIKYVTLHHTNVGETAYERHVKRALKDSFPERPIRSFFKGYHGPEYLKEVLLGSR